MTHDELDINASNKKNISDIEPVFSCITFLFVDIESKPNS